MSATNIFVSHCPQIRSRYDLTDSPEQRWRTIRAVADDASIGNGMCWVGSGDGSFTNRGVPGGPGRSGRRRSRSLTSLLEEAFMRRLTTAIGAGDCAAVVDPNNSDGLLSPRSCAKLYNHNDVVNQKLDLDSVSGGYALTMVGPPQHHLPVKLSSLSRPWPPPICTAFGNKTANTPAPGPGSLAVDKLDEALTSPASLSPLISPPFVERQQHCRSSNIPKLVERKREVAQQLKIETVGILARPGHQPDHETNRQQLMQHHMQVTASAAPPTPLSPTLVRASSPVFEKFSFFKRIGRTANKVNVEAPSPNKSSSTESQHSPSGPISPIWSTSSIGTPDTGLPDGQKPVHISRSAAMPHTNYIEVGGRGAVPQLDAPRGASNHVAILCKGVPVDIPIDGNTTVRQVLVELSATRWGHAINPNTAVIIENFTKLGIERRLRREERIRDILSTWRNDTENALVLSLEVRGTDEELDLSNVPKSDQAPKGFVVNMHYLRGPNKWSKRYIILNESGQMVASKKQDPRPGDKDVIHCCHLSDYDIYIPTEAQMRRNLKPPKKYCFAVKSQQKESLFVNTGNYVHFFSTEDPSVAQKFRSHVHAWRSWYLATKLELLKKDKKPPQTVPVPPQSRRMSMSRERPVPNGYKTRTSVDESPYPMSPSEPLINSKRFNQPLEEHGKNRTSEQTTELTAPKPLSSAQAAIVEANAAAFAANSLLGNAYEERRQQAQKEEKRAGQAHYDDPSSPASPFTDGPSLLNQQAGLSVSHASPKVDYAQLSSKTDRKPLPQMVAGKPAGWFPSALEHSAQQRTSNPPVQLPSQPLARRPSNSSRMQQPRARSMSRRIPQDGPGSGMGLEQGHPQRRANQPAQPLIDLTPGFIEAPQWSREGRGRGVRAPEGKPLVDLATGPSASFHQEGPPKPLIRREDVPPPSSAGQTLLQQQESRAAAAAAAAASGARPMTSSRAAAPIMRRPTTSSGPMRRGTVKSSTGGMVGVVGGGRPGTSGSHGQQGAMQGQPMQGQQHVMTESNRARGISMNVGEKVGGWIGGVGEGQMGENNWQQQGQNQGQHRRRGMSAAVGGHQMGGGQ